MLLHSTTPFLPSILKAHTIVCVEKVSERGFHWVEPQLGTFAVEPFSLVGVFMRMVGVDAVRPSLNLRRGLGSAISSQTPAP